MVMKAKTRQEHVKGYRDIKEIPKVQRYAGSAGLEELFDEEMKRDREERKEKVREAVERHGYSQKEVADYIGVHYSVISKLLKG